MNLSTVDLDEKDRGLGDRMFSSLRSILRKDVGDLLLSISPSGNR